MAGAISPEAEKYIDCLSDIKWRLDHNFEKYHIPASGNGVSMIELESACLQLRMVIETLVFASLVANKTEYERTWASYRKEKDFSKVSKRLLMINPQCLPTSVELKGRSPDGTMRMEDGRIQIKMSELSETVGRLGNLLHARNPYREPLDYQDYAKQLSEMTKRLKAYLRNHVAILSNGEHVFVQMRERGERVKVHMMRMKNV